MDTEERTHKTELRELLAQLLTRVHVHGSRSSEVREFVSQHKDVPEFSQLAATCIFMVEGHETTKRKSAKMIRYAVRCGMAMVCSIVLGIFVQPYIGLIFMLAWVAGFISGVRQ